MKGVWNSAVVENARSRMIAVVLKGLTAFVLGIVALSFPRSPKEAGQRWALSRQCLQGRRIWSTGVAESVPKRHGTLQKGPEPQEHKEGHLILSWKAVKAPLAEATLSLKSKRTEEELGKND